MREPLRLTPPSTGDGTIKTKSAKHEVNGKHDINGKYEVNGKHESNGTSSPKVGSSTKYPTATFLTHTQMQTAGGLSRATKLKWLLEETSELLVCPGVYDGFSARIALDVGFKALYMVSTCRPCQLEEGYPDTCEHRLVLVQRLLV